MVNLPVLITKIASKVDGSVTIALETRELPPQSAAEVFGLRNKEAWALLAEKRISESEIPDEEVDTGLGSKTPSQRLRNVMYILYTQGGKQGSFDDYYKHNMEKIIETLKDRIEE